MKPMINIHDAMTGETISREMTDEEYAELLVTGWVEIGETTSVTPFRFMGIASE